jgi:transglutaminase-like putative cysteine protease
MKTLLMVCAVLWLALPGLETPARSVDKKTPVLDPELAYQVQKSNPVIYQVDFAVVVTAPYHTKLLKVWLPLPQTDAGQEVQEKELSAFPLQVKPRIGKEPTFGNQFAYFEFAHPEGAQIIRHKFQIKVWELRWHLDPAQVQPVKHWPDGFARYLRTEQTVVVDDRFRKVARDVVPESHGPAQDMTAVLAWVDGYMKYDHGTASLQASALHALENKAGHCNDYHGLCAALGRALGYPTRVTYGINTIPKNSPSHCKLEAYLPPYGWVSFDVSETQQLKNLIRKDAHLEAAEKERLIEAVSQRFRQGFRDNTWYVQTRGSDYDLAPPAAKRVPVVRTIYAEADGVALPDPDPANAHKREFSWMTIHQYTPDRTVTYPFKNWQDLLDRR